MAPSSAFRRAHRAYQLAHAKAALRAIVVAGLIVTFAAGLYHTTHTSWLVASTLAATLGALAWRGGAWHRGAFAGVLAGLPPLVVPSIVMALSPAQPCASCSTGPTWVCVLSCFGASLVVGTLVGHRATTDRTPLRFGAAALATAALTGLLGCGTIGLGGAFGILVGLVAGGVTGWIALPARRPMS
jgi:hypothetical protein